MKTLEFRDGERDVLDHVAALLKGVRTWELTYDQAVQQAHTQLLRDKLENAQRDLVRQHFVRQRRGPGS